MFYIKLHTPTVHLYLTVVGEEVEEQVVVNNQFNPTKSNRGQIESQCDGNHSRGRGNEVPMGYEKKVSVNDKFVSDNDTFVSDNDKDAKMGTTELQHQNLLEFGEVPKIYDRRCQEKSNEGWSDDEYTQRTTNFNPWYCIPSIPDCPEPILEHGPFHSLGPNDKLIVNQTYNTKKYLDFFVKFKSIREKFQIKVQKSSKSRYQVVCMQENCHWRLYTSLIQGT
uniref:Transposase MuDR plant domain-containing protein n=1 Tax=Lactuca sativa TaxID=4236 RepID=A0A9R1WK02_LACSA|nr:hypothetical protein LSAT_V11C200063660 [Lactuca sativa]